LTGILLGVLSAVVSVAAGHALENRRELFLGIEGDATILTVRAAPDSTSFPGAARDLVNFLRARNLALVGASVGDGYPAVTVLDPSALVPWFPSDEQDWSSGESAAYLFRGSYSAMLWRASGHTPYLPDATHVAGEVTPGVDVGELQFAWVPGDLGIDSGRYVVNSVEEQAVQELMDMIEGTGLQVDQVQALPLRMYLRSQPFLVLSLVLLLGGTLGASINLNSRIVASQRAVRIHAAHGATARLMVRRLGPPWVGRLALGAAAGVGVVAAVDWFAFQGGFGHAECVALAIGWVASMVAIGLCLLAVLGSTIKWVLGRNADAA
jgi:hypothetical protein